MFGNRNAWITRSLEYVARMHAERLSRRYRTACCPTASTRAVNLTTAPLLDLDNKAIGYMLVLEDITREKRVRSTMSRYMAKEVVDRLLASGDEVLKGSAHVATVMFSDIRQFHHADRDDEPAADGGDAQRVFHRDGGRGADAMAACSTSISATR